MMPYICDRCGQRLFHEAGKKFAINGFPVCEKCFRKEDLKEGN